MLRALLLVALLFAAAPAHADYVFDPADLPEGFECDSELSEKQCAIETRLEAWFHTFDDRVDYWHHALLFNTNDYFARRVDPVADFNFSAPYHEHEQWLGYRTPNLVDAFYSIALRRGQGWAFAINENAVLRMVRRRRTDEIAPELVEKYDWWMPTTLAETAELLTVFWAFDEADLTRCDGAITHLRAFPAQKDQSLWDERALKWSPDYKDRPDRDTLIVTTDGDGVFVRARGVLDQRTDIRIVQPRFIIYDESNGGPGYDWAIEMERIVQPCLQASDATPPWELYLDAANSAANAALEAP